MYLTPKYATFVVYVSHVSPRAWLRITFTDVGPKVLVSYYGHSYGAQILCWRLSNGERQKPYLLKGRWQPGGLGAYKTPVLLKAKS